MKNEELRDLLLFICRRKMNNNKLSLCKKDKFENGKKLYMLYGTQTMKDVFLDALSGKSKDDVGILIDTFSLVSARVVAIRYGATPSSIRNKKERFLIKFYHSLKKFEI